MIRAQRGRGTRCIIAAGFIIPAMVVNGCATYPIAVPKTMPEPPKVQVAANPGSRVIFLSPTEAKCPNRCTGAVAAGAYYNQTVSHIEEQLQSRGFKLISGAIVSRVEDKLKGTTARESWDRTEKALLLGKESGADAIFELRAVYVDRYSQFYLKEAGSDVFVSKPQRTVESAIERWRSEKPSAGWWWLPIFGWIRLALADSPPSSFELPTWDAIVDTRMYDLDGNVIWSGYASIRTTDVIEETWTAELNGKYPTSQIVSGSENFSFNEYVEDDKLQRSELHAIIDQLVARIPQPSSKPANKPTGGRSR